MAELIEQKEKWSEQKVNSTKPRYESPKVMPLSQLEVGQGGGTGSCSTPAPSDGAICTSGSIASACMNGGGVG